MPKKVTTFNIDSEVLDAAKVIAKEINRSLSAYVQDAISTQNKYLQNKKAEDSQTAPSEPEAHVFKVQ